MSVSVDCERAAEHSRLLGTTGGQGLAEAVKWKEQHGLTARARIMEGCMEEEEYLI